MPPHRLAGPRRPRRGRSLALLPAVAVALVLTGVGTASAAEPVDPTPSRAMPAAVPLAVTPETGTAKATRLAGSRRPLPKPPTVSVTPPVTLPTAVDAIPAYVGQNSCDPTDKPGSVAYGKLLKSIYPAGIVGISRSCQESGTSEHKDGRAVDFMINANDPAQKKVGDAIVGWLTADNGAMARRLGVMYLIWNKQFWGAYAPGDGWTPYTGSSPHTDHIHTSLTWDGAMMRTSWYTGVPLKASDRGTCVSYVGDPAVLYTGLRLSCPAAVAGPKTTHATLLWGASGAEVSTAQRLMGVTVSGSFTSTFWASVKSFQSGRGLPVTGAVDQATWAALDPASRR